MKANIIKDDSCIDEAYNVASLWLRYIFGEVHLPIREDNNSALVEKLSPISER